MVLSLPCYCCVRSVTRACVKDPSSRKRQQNLHVSFPGSAGVPRALCHFGIAWHRLASCDSLLAPVPGAVCVQAFDH